MLVLPVILGVKFCHKVEPLSAYAVHAVIGALI